jgi:hypothetical protein
MNEITVANLDRDPVTGFLTKSNHAVESGPGVRSELGFYLPGHGVVRELVFDSDKKSELLKALEECWPGIGDACHAIGISTQTYYNHLAIDEAFRNAVNELKERMIGRIERMRMAVAQTPMGSFDRMCVLNAYRREIYNPKVQIEVEHKITADEGRRRLDALSHAVDVEIVDTVKKIKAQRQGKSRPQNPNGRGDTK